MTSKSIIESLQASLPDRSLKIKSEWHFYIPPISFVLLIFVIYSLSNLFTASKSLLNDWKISDQLIPVVATIETNCGYLPSKESSRLRRNPFGYRCEICAEISNTQWQQTLQSTQLFTEDLDNIQLLQDQKNPNRFTTSLAQELLKKRGAFLLQSFFFLLISLYILISMIRVMVRHYQSQGDEYQFIELPIHLSRSTFIRYQIVNYVWNNRTYKTTFSLNDGPIILSQNNESLLVLALSQKNQVDPPQVIDQKLKRINLTKTERDNLLNALKKSGLIK